MLNYSKIAAKSIWSVADSLLNITTKLSEQQFRTTYILERIKPFPLYKKCQRPIKMKHRHFLYRLVQDTDVKKQEPLQVILTTDVEGLGEKGDVVSVKRRTAYNKLLLPKLAVYASAENLKKYSEKVQGTERTYSSLRAPQVMKYLSIMRLGVMMSAENPWIVEKWHVKACFRRAGVEIPEDAIEIPEKSISGPDFDLEGKEFYCTVTINNKEKVNVRCAIHHVSIDPNKKMPFPENYWQYPGEPIHPEFTEILNSMSKNYKLMNEKKPEIKIEM